MSVQIRDLRYVRIAAKDIEESTSFAASIVGLQTVDNDKRRAYFRSDERAYSLCYSSAEGSDAIALTVGTEDELQVLATRLEAAAIKYRRLNSTECAIRKIKHGLACLAPNGIVVEFVWRPLTSGWRYFGGRDAGITDLLSVSLCCTSIAPNEGFWTEIVGGEVSDWAGDASYIRIDEAHHRIALYPSERDGLLGIDFAVESINNVMQSFYFLQDRQLPIVHGPGKQPASEKIFVTTKGPRDILYTYGTGMTSGEILHGRNPRQFPAEPESHCAWGSATLQPEFLGEGWREEAQR